MPINKSMYGAGLKDAKVRTADGNVYDIYGVIGSEGEPAQDEIEVNGDDRLLGTFISNIREELTVTANGIDFETLQAITGNTVESNGSNITLLLGTESQQNPPFVELQGFITAKDDAGNSVVVQKTYFKVQFKTVKVMSENGGEMNLEMTGIAYQTEADITGAALDSAAVASLSATMQS